MHPSEWSQLKHEIRRELDKCVAEKLPENEFTVGAHQVYRLFWK